MREWITELTKDLFSEKQGLFRTLRTQHGILYFPNSKAKHIYGVAEARDYFRFAGQVLAKALFEKIPVLLSLNKLLLSLLIGNHSATSQVKLDDLKYYDTQIYNSIKFLAEDPTMDFQLDEFFYTIMKDDGEEVELCKDGKSKRVTAQNRKDYAQKVAKFYLYKDAKEEIRQFVKGFH